MKILLSIKPHYAEMILNGTKRFEYRRALYRNKDVQSVVMYATKPVSKVIGEFEVGGVLADAPGSLWASTKEHSGITKRLFFSYFHDRATAFAIQVKNPTRYQEPLSLDRLAGASRAPQSFMYL